MAEEGNSKWKQLQEMRKASGIPVTEPTKPTEEPEGAEMKKLAAEQPRDEAGKFAKAEDVPPAPAVPPAAEQPPKVEQPVAAKPSYAEIDIDGVKVSVDPSLAEAFSKAEKIKVDTVKAAERETLKTELRNELKAELLPPPKTEADLAADKALAAAEEAAKLIKKPDSKTLIDNPEEYEKQRDAYEEARINTAIARSKAEYAIEHQKTQQKAIVEGEAHARGVLREQFFRAYPVLRDSADLVTPLLEAKFTEVAASGKLAKPLTDAEREDLKVTEFADVAAKATRKIVNLMTQGKKLVPPPPPPTLASSAPSKPANPEAKKPEGEKKAKYPAGSVSALLAAQKAARSASAA